MPLVSLLAWFRRLRQLGRRSGVERDMHDEFRFHVDSYAADLVRKGLSPEEARRRAHLEFGGVEAWKIDGRDALGFRLFDELHGDLRYTWRQLRRSPGFASIAILSIALGIGANTAIFSLMEAVLWKPMPVHEPDQLRLFTWVSGPNVVMNSSMGTWSGGRRDAGGVHSASFSYAAFKGFEQAPSPFERIYGIMAQNVSRRTSEIGVRLALGASRGGVLLMVLREVSLLAVIGIVLGTAAALGFGRYVESMLFGLTQYDPVAIGGAIVTMLVVAVLAGWVPALRACRLDPMVALRHE